MKITITKTIDIKDLTPVDIKSLDKETLERIVTYLSNKPSKPSKPVSTCPKPIKAVIEHPKTSVPISSGKSKGHEIGVKSGKTSKYSYVYWHTSSKSFRIVHDSKLSFSDEIEAALASDKYLDDTNNKIKPRNRDKYFEIAELYKGVDTTPSINNYVKENM